MNSVVPKEAIEVIAQSIGVTNLSPDVSMALAPDVEYRVREIMQEAIKCMRHSRRTTLTTNDVDSALKLRNVEPLYGFASGDSLRLKRAAGHKDLFYVDDKDLEFKDIIETPLPKAPLDVSVASHWLAIEGVNPAIPENPQVEVSSDGKKLENKEDGFSIEIKLPIKHVLSKELQLYFEKMTSITVNKSNSVLFKQVLLSLATDAGLHSLIPYFICFISDEVTRNLNNFSLLFAVMRVARSLLQNPHIHIEPYLHQLLPSIITCLVAKSLGSRISDNHWDLRKFSANLVASICHRFGHIYSNLQPRVTRTLLHAFLDPTKTLPQHYGAIQGLAALGPSVVRLLILPNLEPYMQLLLPEMQIEKSKNEMKRHEAWRVHGALLCAAGKCMHEKLKKYRSLFSPPTRLVLKSNKKIAIPMTNKRKASTDNLTQQPPMKRLATEGIVGGPILPVNSVQMAASGLPAGIVGPGMPSMPRQLSTDQLSRRDFSGQTARTVPAVLAQAWKEDMDSGQLLAAMSEFFGQSVFSFTPKSELNLFL